MSQPIPHKPGKVVVQMVVYLPSPLTKKPVLASFLKGGSEDTLSVQSPFRGSSFCGSFSAGPVRQGPPQVVSASGSGSLGLLAHHMEQQRASQEESRQERRQEQIETHRRACD